MPRNGAQPSGCESVIVSIPENLGAESIASAAKVELEDRARVTHDRLVLLGGVVYVAQVVVGSVLVGALWQRREHRVLRYFTVARLLTCMYLLSSIHQLHVDFEPCHPGLDLVYTVVNTLSVACLTLSSKERLQSPLSIFIVVTASIDILVLIATWRSLSRCRRDIVERLENIPSKGGIACPTEERILRYVEFMPRAGSHHEVGYARSLLWNSVRIFGS
ncbi:unnamed protein product [Polarella glacialis]|uniref:Uncharacterized protein n=1 Tax=Polarella glacialis TaxID=89957 RepID=A0A813K2E1_POLGL|nr:unnamed protein product [Polarella glacialis]